MRNGDSWVNYCGNCGARLGVGTDFCSHCGSRVSQGTSTADKTVGSTLEPGAEPGYQRRSHRTLSWIGAILGLVILLSILLPDIGRSPFATQASFIELGAGQLGPSESLGRTGVATRFQRGSEIWMRLELAKEFSTSEVIFFLESQEKGEPGWNPKESWSVTTNPSNNILRSRGWELQRLEPGRYKLFVTTGGKKRAEAEFTITAVGEQQV